MTVTPKGLRAYAEHAVKIDRPTRKMLRDAADTIEALQAKAILTEADLDSVRARGYLMGKEATEKLTAVEAKPALDADALVVQLGKFIYEHPLAMNKCGDEGDAYGIARDYFDRFALQETRPILATSQPDGSITYAYLNQEDRIHSLEAALRRIANHDDSRWLPDEQGMPTISQDSPQEIAREALSTSAPEGPDA